MGESGAAAFVALVSLSMIVSATALLDFQLPPLPYTYDALENYIDTETMTLHHTRHHKAAVDALNAAIHQAPDLTRYMLTPLLSTVGSKDWSSIPENVTRAIRNNAGSHFNHAMFWRIMRPYWYSYDPARPRNVPSRQLQNAINKAFGSADTFKSTFSEAAAKVFGSGWTWLIVTKKGKLVVVTTPNQDNPLMTNVVEPSKQGIPILGLDVWEHAYYLKHRNVRKNYIDAWWNVVNWPQVSRNYRFAIKGDAEKIWYG